MSGRYVSISIYWGRLCGAFPRPILPIRLLKGAIVPRTAMYSKLQHYMNIEILNKSGGTSFMMLNKITSQIRLRYFHPCPCQHLIKSLNLLPPMHVVYQLPRISSIASPAPECISIALCDEQGWRVVTCYDYASRRGACEKVYSYPFPTRGLREASQVGKLVCGEVDGLMLGGFVMRRFCEI